MFKFVHVLNKALHLEDVLGNEGISFRQSEPQLYYIEVSSQLHALTALL
jgi:hypothetical protein